MSTYTVFAWSLHLSVHMDS